MTPMNDDLLTIDELAARLKIHTCTLRSLYRRHAIPGLKLGHRTLRFSYPDVLQALREANDPAVAE